MVTVYELFVINKSHEFDVVIVGAGPAGTAAAIQCAKHGLSTILLERKEFPRHRPGETMHPGIEPLLKQLGVETKFLEDYVRYQGIWTNLTGNWQFLALGGDRNETWQGYQVNRAEFDRVLLNHATKLGCKVQVPVRVKRPIIRAGRVIGVEVDSKEIYCRFLIDCSGASHWLSNRLGQKPIVNSPLLIADYGYCSITKFEESELPRFEKFKDGWNWTAKVDNSKFAWVSVGKTGKKPSERYGRENVTWRCVSKPADLGYAISGDAAFVLDPSSGHGVLRAIMGGMMASQLCWKITVHPAEEQRLIQGYCHWVEDFYRSEVDHLRSFAVG